MNKNEDWKFHLISYLTLWNFGGRSECHASVPRFVLISPPPLPQYKTSSTANDALLFLLSDWLIFCHMITPLVSLLGSLFISCFSLTKVHARNVGLRFPFIGGLPTFYISIFIFNKLGYTRILKKWAQNIILTLVRDNIERS